MVLRWPKMLRARIAQDCPKMAQDGPEMGRDAPKKRKEKKKNKKKKCSTQETATDPKVRFWEGFVSGW